MGWADSLLRFAYEFINDFIASQAPAEAPFVIPQLQFVKAAIAYSEKSLDNALGASASTSHRAAYLLEELLPTSKLIEQEGANNVLFGEGNVNSAFKAFTVQHQCNHYCTWFQLEELEAPKV